MAGRSFWTNVTIVTASLTLFGGLVSSGIALMGSAQQTQNEIESDICKLAYETIGDETLNPGLTPAETRHLLVDQLLLVQKCAQRIK